MKIDLNTNDEKYSNNLKDVMNIIEKYQYSHDETEKMHEGLDSIINLIKISIVTDKDKIDSLEKLKNDNECLIEQLKKQLNDKNNELNGKNKIIQNMNDKQIESFYNLWIDNFKDKGHTIKAISFDVFKNEFKIPIKNNNLNQSHFFITFFMFFR